MQGRHEEALADLQVLRSAFPDDVTLLLKIGVCQMRLRRPKRALQTFDEIVARDPGNAQAHYQRGAVFGMLGETGAMKEAFDAALARDPENVDALAGMALYHARSSEYEPAGRLSARALAHAPGHMVAQNVALLVAIAEGTIGASDGRLHHILENPLFAVGTPFGHGLNLALEEAGSSGDRAGRTEEAFAIWEILNRRRYDAFLPQLGPERSVAQVRRRILELKPYEPPPSSRVACPAAGHAFLLGFMRSGTTLLETVLAASEHVVALDEFDFLSEGVREYIVPRDGLEKLARAPDEALQPLRDSYWRSVREAGISYEGKVYLDKLPLNSLRLPLIARLFPEAKILLAIRDPRDVVFSCFRHSFEVGLQTFEYLRLDDCANYYAATMEFVELCRDRIPMSVHEHHYEKMVADFETSVRSVCDFIGIAWDESLRNFGKASGVVNERSVSASQVSKGLYAGASGQWRRYQERLGVIYPILEPWVARFGYAPT
jgi:tetratricopeptide (TPR) repeat protein